MKKQSILAIDDTEDTLVLSKIILELGGFEVHTAQTGDDAISLLSRINEPSLILLDMQIGDMTGTEFLDKLEVAKPSIFNNVPIVFYTGLENVPKSKAVGVIKKPADMDLFLQVIKSFVKKAS